MKTKSLSKILVVLLTLSLILESKNLLAWDDDEPPSKSKCTTSTYSLKKLGVAVTGCALFFACIKAPVNHLMKSHAESQQNQKILDVLTQKKVDFDIHSEIAKDYQYGNRYGYYRLLNFYVTNGDKESFRDLLKITSKNEKNFEASLLPETYKALLFSQKSENFLKIFLEEFPENTHKISFHVDADILTYLYNKKEYFNVDLMIKHAIENDSSERLLFKLLDMNKTDLFLYFIQKVKFQLKPSSIDNIVYTGNQKFIDEAFSYVDFSLPFKASEDFQLEGIAKYDLAKSFVFLDQKEIFSDEFLFEIFLPQVAYYNSHKVLKKILDRFENNPDKELIYKKIFFNMLQETSNLRPSTMEILESYSVDLHFNDDYLLYEAVRSGNVELTKWLLKKGFKFKE